jgi:hypothetical protein
MDADRLYLVPEQILKSWQREQRVREIDRPRDTVLAAGDENVTEALKKASMTDYDRNLLVEQRVAQFLKEKALREASATSTSYPHASATPVSTGEQQQQQQQQEQQQSPETTRPSKDAYVTKLPKTYRERGAQLLRLWESDGDITWNADGRVSLKGREIPGSNLQRLLHHAVSDRGLRTPRGFQEMRRHSIDKRHAGRLYVNPVYGDPTAGPKDNERAGGSEESGVRAKARSKQDSRVRGWIPSDAVPIAKKRIRRGRAKGDPIGTIDSGSLIRLWETLA